MATPLTHAQLSALWITAGGSPDLADTAAAVAQAESGGDPSRINNTAHPNLPNYHPPAPGNLPEYSIGLWQINQVAHPTFTTAQLLTPAGNAAAAVSLATGSVPFYPWTTYRNGTYAPFLAGASAAPPGGPVGPVGPATGLAPQAHSGYADLRNSLARHLPTDLLISQRATAGARRALASRRKVSR